MHRKFILPVKFPSRTISRTSLPAEVLVNCCSYCSSAFSLRYCAPAKNIGLAIGTNHSNDYAIIVFRLTIILDYRVNLEDNVFRSASDERAVVNGTLTIEETPNNPTSLLLWWSVSHTFCLTVYIVLNAMILLAVSIRCVSQVLFFTEASINLHNNMFSAVTRAKMYFFYTNSSGNNDDVFIYITS